MALTPFLHVNFGQSTIFAPPSPSLSGTSVTIDLADVALFPTSGLFWAIAWPQNSPLNGANAEIWLVTALISNVWTITRAQQNTTAKAFAVGDNVIGGITAADLIVSGSLALGNGVTGGTVSSLNLPYTPSRVLPTVSRPTGGLMIFACVDPTSITSGGFSFDLSAMTNSTNYVLDYIICP